jgi:hypothetical protein
MQEAEHEAIVERIQALLANESYNRPAEPQGGGTDAPA